LIAYLVLEPRGVLCAGLFAWNTYGMSGSLYQAFAHAILVVGMLYISGAMKERVGTSEMGAMGGLKARVPRLAALFLLVLVNAIALPLTQSFVGEWLMFAGLWQVNGGWRFAAVIHHRTGCHLHALRLSARDARSGQVGDGDEDATTARPHWYLVPLDRPHLHPRRASRSHPRTCGWALFKCNSPPFPSVN
jgi:hypothetical protein